MVKKVNADCPVNLIVFIISCQESRSFSDLLHVRVSPHNAGEVEVDRDHDKALKLMNTRLDIVETETVDQFLLTAWQVLGNFHRSVDILKVFLT